MSVSLLCEQLVKQGVEVSVFTTTANGQHELPVTAGQAVVIDGVSVTYFKRISKDHTHFSPALLRAVWCNVKQFDLVHVHAWWNLVSVLGAFIAVIRGVPLIVSPRGTLSFYSFTVNNSFVKRIIHTLVGKPVLKRAVIHVTSVHERENILGLISPRKLFVIPNLVKIAEQTFPNDMGTTGPLKLIFFSRIEPKKGLDILLQALTLVTIPFSLSIVGDGDETYIDELKNKAINYNIADKLYWFGFVRENKFEVLAQHQLFVLPSFDENFGNAVIECLSAGTAVLVSDKVGLANYIVENQLGWVCNNTPGDIAEHITNIASAQHRQLEQIRQSGPQKIARDFAPASLIKLYISAYNQIIQL
jgi:glycosyltransferase involved in cell wall biosynthesis